MFPCSKNFEQLFNLSQMHSNFKIKRNFSRYTVRHVKATNETYMARANILLAYCIYSDTVSTVMYKRDCRDVTA